MARIRWTASIVASVPELLKRHSGQPEAPAELLGHDDRVLGRLGEVGAERHPALHRLDDGRVGVADHHHAVAAVQVDVLGRRRRRRPSTPAPWLTQTVAGRAIIQLEVAPPASERRARSAIAAERGWRARNASSSRAIRSVIVDRILAASASGAIGWSTPSVPAAA